MTYQPQRKKRWSRDDIRSARRAHLKPVLENLGYRLRPLENGNYEVCGISCTVIIKENYWLCTDDQRSGNVIDFCMMILNISFNKAMEVITRTDSYDNNGNTLRSEREKTGGFVQL